jgi:hypothetical protein
MKSPSETRISNGLWLCQSPKLCRSADVRHIAIFFGVVLTEAAKGNGYWSAGPNVKVLLALIASER